MPVIGTEWASMFNPWAGAGGGRSLAGRRGRSDRRGEERGVEAGSPVTQLAVGPSDVPPCAGRPRRSHAAWAGVSGRAPSAVVAALAAAASARMAL